MTCLRRCTTNAPRTFWLVVQGRQTVLHSEASMRALIGVELLRKLPAAPVEIRDVKLPGFALRVRLSGTHSYLVSLGRGRWQTLGTTAVLTAPEAREQARQALADVAKGADPIAKRKAEQARLPFDSFITEHYEPWATAQRKTGAEQTARLKATFSPALKGLRLDGDHGLPCRAVAFGSAQGRADRVNGQSGFERAPRRPLTGRRLGPPARAPARQGEGLEDRPERRGSLPDG